MKFDESRPNKIIEYFNNLNDQVRYAILVGVVFLIILLDVFLLVLPQMGSIADVNDQIKKLSDDTQQVLMDRQRINLLKKNLQETRAQLDALSARCAPSRKSLLFSAPSPALPMNTVSRSTSWSLKKASRKL